MNAKFSMSNKELKSMLDKAVTTICKKSSVPGFTKVYFEVTANSTVKVLGTDIEHWIEVRSDNAYDTFPGVFGIDVDDINVLTKMKDDITMEVTNITKNGGTISIKCGKKKVNIPMYHNVDVFLPAMDKTEEHILTVNESWLLETVTNLAVYTSGSDANIMMQAFNFNTNPKENRVETIDGHRIGMRTLCNQKIIKENKSVMLCNKCLPVFKKVLDKKENEDVEILQDKKYVRVEGNDFTYITRKIAGEYFNVDGILPKDYEYSFTPDRENILSVMEYDANLTKGTRNPIVFHSENGKLYTYIKTNRYEMFDEIETTDNQMKDDLYIGFNPVFMKDVFKMVDSENPVCKGENNISPLMIYGNEYSFLILPVNIKERIADGSLRNAFAENIAA